MGECLHDPANAEEAACLPIIKIRINGVELRVLVDTGAEISLINENIILDHCEIFQTKIVPIRCINLITANSRKITTVNQMLIGEIKIGEVIRTEGIMIMKNLKLQGLLGVDLLHNFKVKIDMDKKQIEIDGKQITWESLNENKFRPKLEINLINKRQIAEISEFKINLAGDQKQKKRQT